MPKCKDSLEVMAAKQERKDKLREFFRCLKLTICTTCNRFSRRWLEKFSKTDFKRNLMTSWVTANMIIATKTRKTVANRKFA